MDEQKIVSIYNHITESLSEVEKLNEAYHKAEFNRIIINLRECLFQLNLLADENKIDIKSLQKSLASSNFEWYDAETDEPEHGKPLIVILQSIANGVLMNSYAYSTASYELCKAGNFYSGLNRTGIVKYWAYLTPPDKKLVKIMNFY